MACFRTPMAFLVAMAVLGLSLSGAGALAAEDDALMETVIKGLEDRDKALSEFHLSVFCRSWMSDTQIEADTHLFREMLKAEAPPEFQNRGLSVSDLYYHGPQWCLDSALLVSDGRNVPPGFIARVDAGAKSLDPDMPGWGAPAGRMCCDGESIRRWQVDTRDGEVRKIKRPKGSRRMIDHLMNETLVWILGGPPGEFFRENRPYAIEGPVQADGHECYRVSYARNRPRGVGPYRLEAWVAPGLGYSVVRTSYLSIDEADNQSGSRREKYATGFRQVSPGVWFPSEVVSHDYGYYKASDEPWRETRVYTVREVAVGPGTAPGDGPFELRFPIGVRYTAWDETGKPVDRETERAEFDTREEWTLVHTFQEWKPPPVDENLNRPLQQADVDALMADVARAEAARAGKEVD